MTGESNKLSCEQFLAQLAELVGSGEEAAAHPHLVDCARCRALLADLETIAEAARQLFPMVEPPDEVWEHIESAIKKEEGSPEPKPAGVDGSASPSQPS
jgi:hypothetical protein